MLSGARRIERIQPPSRKHFYEAYVLANRPVILEGLVDRWPGKTLWSPQYYAQTYGDVRVTVAGTQRDGQLVLDLKDGLRFREITLREYVETMQETASSGTYVVSETSRFPDQFRRELMVPEYCRGAAWLRSKLWFGSKGTVTQTHKGAPENLYSVVTGHKRFVMFPPDHSRLLYAYSVFSKLPNFSPVNPEKPDYSRYPRSARAKAWIADLRDGDTLFIPRFWWHHVRTVESTIAVNFWWARGYTMVISALAHLYKKARGLTT